MLCLLFAKPNTLPAAPQSSFSLFVLAPGRPLPQKALSEVLKELPLCLRLLLLRSEPGSFFFLSFFLYHLCGFFSPEART